MGTQNTPRKRQRRNYEAPDMAAFVKRTMRAMVRRADDKDLEVIVALADIQAAVDKAMVDAADALRANGYSWTDIGRELGITRQAAQQRFGKIRRQVEAAIPAGQTTLDDFLTERVCAVCELPESAGHLVGCPEGR